MVRINHKCSRCYAANRILLLTMVQDIAIVSSRAQAPRSDAHSEDGLVLNYSGVVVRGQNRSEVADHANSALDAPHVVDLHP